MNGDPFPGKAGGPGRRVPGRGGVLGRDPDLAAVPGDMGRCSYVLVGTEQAMHESFGSCCHGAGRRLSRHAALRAARSRHIASELAERGVHVRAADRRTVDEEMPDAYKDVANVVGVVERAALARRVARIRPIGVTKG